MLRDGRVETASTWRQAWVGDLDRALEDFETAPFLYPDAVGTVVSIYGWFAWGKDGSETSEIIRTWPIERHLVTCAKLLFLSLAVGAAMNTFTDAASPFVDAGTTISALLATWMVANKLLENWLYWIVIDIASVGLYLSRDLTLTAALFAAYVILAGWGYVTWRKQWTTQLSA